MRHGGCTGFANEAPRGRGDRAVSAPDRRRSLVPRLGLSALVALGLLLPGAVAAADQQLAFGVKMAQRGLWSEALFRFRQADRESPNNPRVLNNLAVAYEAVGLFDEALETYQSALKIDPANRELRRNYARFIEFYQAFKPDEEEADEEAGEDAVEETAEGERPASAAAGSPPEDGAGD